MSCLTPPSSPRPLPRSLSGHARRQRGSIILIGALAMTIAVVLLGIIDIGFLYYYKREYQRAADLGAMAGSSELWEESRCAQATGKARAIAMRNLPGHQIDPGVSCGHWEAASGFDATQTPINAVRVDISGYPPWFIFKRSRISASAVATSGRATAAFSVGSQLLRLNGNAPLGRILAGVGLDANKLTVLDHAGLVNAKITPSGLLGLLAPVGIGNLELLTPEGLLDLADVSVARLLEVSAQVVTDSVLRAQLEALSVDLLKAGLGAVKIPLGSSDGQTGLFTFLGIGKTDPIGSALDVQLGLASLIKTAIAIGAQGRSVAIPGLDVLGGVKLEAGIVEPPTIAIGPVGTTAHSAQVRAYLNIDTDQLLGGILRPLTALLGVRVNLPVSIDVTSSTGELDQLMCDRGEPTADIVVTSKIANVCVGKMPASHRWSSSAGCEANVEEDTLIKLLHIPVLSGKTHIQALVDTDDTSALGMKQGDVRTTRVNSVKLANTVDNIVDGLLNLLSGLLRPPATVGNDDLDYNGPNKNEQIKQLAEAYLEETKVNGFYNIDKVIDAVLNGTGSGGLDPLATQDWMMPRSIPVSCGLFICPNNDVTPWRDGTFSEAMKFYAGTPGSLLDLLGITTLPNGYQSCAGLLSSLLNWNGCVKHNLTKLLTSHPQYVMDNANVNDILDRNKTTLACNGALCVLLKPIVALLKPILVGLGELLNVALRDILGLELGRADVELLSIDCGGGALVQ